MLQHQVRVVSACLCTWFVVASAALKALSAPPQLAKGLSRQSEDGGPTPRWLGRFDGLPVSIVPGRTGFAIRDVGEDSDFYVLDTGKDQTFAFGLAFEAHQNHTPRATHFRCKLSSVRGVPQAVTLIYTLKLDGDGWRWLTPRAAQEVTGGAEQRSAGPNGKLSAWPLAAVGRGAQGHAILLDPAFPACFRLGYAASSNELYLAFDLGFMAGKTQAEFGFYVFPFDAAWGLRRAVETMYELLPVHYTVRAKEQGLWSPFAPLSKVEGVEDFGIRFKSGDAEAAWDNTAGILSLRYHEPMTWWMKMPFDMPRTIDAATREAMRLSRDGHPSAHLLQTAGFFDESVHLAGRFVNVPWCDGIAWSINSAPGVAGRAADLGDSDGAFIDHAEGETAAEYDHRRAHFEPMRTPLTFTPGAPRPAIHRGLIAYEYARALCDEAHAAGKLVMAGGTPHNLCWLAPYADVMGSETDWNPAGQWRPTSDDELLHRRILCGRKPYCLIMNTAFEKFGPDLVEKYMKRCLAYGIFPGFHSHNGAERPYFTRPKLYDRDRPLFRKYVPLCKAIAGAGWEPVTLAHSSDERIHIERFGRKYLTVFNDSTQRKTVTVRLDGLEPAGAVERITGKPVAWNAGSAELTLGAEDLAVLEVK